MHGNPLTRRKLLQNTALTGAALVAAPYVRSAYAAGKVSVGFWDHWVPGANDTLTKLCNEWAAKEKVDITIDYITSQGDKNLLTIAAEAQAKSGHDIMQMPTWWPAAQAELLEPVDDIVTKLIADYGKPSQVVEYLGKVNGHWVAVPATTGSQVKPPCARIDLFKEHVGLDLQKMYPAGAPPDKELSDNWTWDTFLMAAEKCFKAGYPFGMPLGQQSDSVDWVGAVFASYGAQFVDEKGNITITSDATRQALEWFKKIVPFFPPDVFAWDDAGNNKWLISGKGALIMNPPSAWAVAVRDAPKVAEQCWTFAAPKGPKGRYTPGLPYYLAIWQFSPNKPAAKSLITYLSQKSSVEQLVKASHGYDLPAYAGLLDFPTWLEEGPPKGTVYNYPPRGDQIVSIACSPAPPKIANQAYVQATPTKMIARMIQQGDSIEKTIAWAADELEGFMRT
jgi:ABC-type glycerol-3-phosphate transport system substrate-binding protein